MTAGPAAAGPAAAARLPFVQRAVAPAAALPVRPSTAAATPGEPVPLRPTAPISATAPLPVAPVGPRTVQRDALAATAVKDVPVTTVPPEALVTRAERQPPPGEPPSYSASGSGPGPEEPPPGYSAVAEGGFDPRALTEYQVDALVHRIIDRITRHVRTELRRDRERVGKLRDFRS
ncbi:extensin [Streptomyces sp. NPDC101237]|uniref:extensin n=1 Tax=Streptomyces sp. NPDC101237 TaxID=3366139 RepID=UPI003809C7FB